MPEFAGDRRREWCVVQSKDRARRVECFRNAQIPNFFESPSLGVSNE